MSPPAALARRCCRRLRVPFHHRLALPHALHRHRLSHHYQHDEALMAPRFYRIGPAIWLEPWDDEVRLAAMYLLTTPHRTTEGLFRLPIAYACADMDWAPKRFAKALGQLIAAGFVEHDPEAQVMLLVKALKWQAPSNPNQIRAAVSAISQLPATPLLERFLELADTHAPALAKAVRERLAGKPISSTSTQIRDTNLRRVVRERDGDRCRYCGVDVSWSDRRGRHGATYDHVDPYGANEPSNIVIACRGCNSKKASRTPDEAKMQLKPEPGRTQVGPRSDLDQKSGQISNTPSPTQTLTPPTPPMGGLPEPPEPPSGNRDRDRRAHEAQRQAWQQDLRAFLSEAVPDIPLDAAFGLAHRAMTHLGMRDPAGVVAFVRERAGEAAA